MVNFEKNSSKDKSYEAPATYNHGAPQVSGYNNSNSGSGDTNGGYGS